MFPVECVARGYLTGSGWKEYKASGTVCGIPLPAGLLFRCAMPALLLGYALVAAALRGASADVWLLALLTTAGYLAQRLGLQRLPALLGLALAPTLESDLQRTLQAAGGDWGVFLSRPWSASLLMAGALLFVVALLRPVRPSKELHLAED